MLSIQVFVDFGKVKYVKDIYSKVTHRRTFWNSDIDFRLTLRGYTNGKYSLIFRIVIENLRWDHAKNRVFSEVYKVRTLLKDWPTLRSVFSRNLTRCSIDSGTCYQANRMSTQTWHVVGLVKRFFSVVCNARLPSKWIEFIFREVKHLSVPAKMINSCCYVTKHRETLPAGTAKNSMSHRKMFVSALLKTVSTSFSMPK